MVAHLALAPLAVAGGKLSWLDGVLRQAVRNADGERAMVRRGAGATGRLFAFQADESLTSLARRAESIGRLAKNAEEPSEAALRMRFDRLLKPDPAMARAFGELAPLERRLVVELGETAANLARRVGPDEAESIVKRLGVDGLSAVRAYGDDVAETIVREGPEAVDVLRKTGRPGWRFYTETVLKHKKKLAAAGILTVFLADPDRFVDHAGKATEFAIEQFSKAGIDLAGAIGGAAARGAQSAIEQKLAAFGLDPNAARLLGIMVSALIGLGAIFVLFGLPLRWLLLPVTAPLRLVRRLSPLARRPSATRV
jgi:hypothetical protein